MSPTTEWRDIEIVHYQFAHLVTGFELSPDSREK